MRRGLIWGWLILVSVVAKGQDGLANRMAGSEALYSKDPGIWGLKSYAASLAMRKSAMVGVYGEKKFMSELSVVESLISFPLRNYGFLFSISREGITDYLISKVGFSAGVKISTGLMMGINIGYSGEKIKGYASSGELDAGVGILLQLNEKIRVGVQLDHIPSLFETAKFSFQAKAGLGYYLSEVCALSIEVSKMGGKPLIVDMGICYSFHPLFYARLGCSPARSLFSFSTGFRQRQLNIEFGTAYHLSLGPTMGLGLTYRFKQAE